MEGKLCVYNSSHYWDKWLYIWHGHLPSIQGFLFECRLNSIETLFLSLMCNIEININMLAGVC